MKIIQNIIKPVITEKSASITQNNKYIFMVNKNANKNAIKKEIKKIYKVDPVKINIIKISGESKLSRGRYLIQTKSFKKAVITLKKGQKIAGFEAKS